MLLVGVPAGFGLFSQGAGFTWPWAPLSLTVQWLCLEVLKLGMPGAYGSVFQIFQQWE